MAHCIADYPLDAFEASADTEVFLNRVVHRRLMAGDELSDIILDEFGRELTEQAKFAMVGSLAGFGTKIIKRLELVS